MMTRFSTVSTMSFRLTAAGLTLAAITASGGCKKTQSPGSGVNSGQTAPVTSGSATELFEARRFSEAKQVAEAELAKNPTGRSREVPQLIAGLSSHAMGQDAEAQRYLEPLTGSADPQISGRAEAALGQIAQKRGQHAYAADLLTRAASKLDGDDAARASVRAGNSLAAINKNSEAMTQYRNAQTQAESDEVRKHAATMTEPGPFALQTGVFSTRANAERRAGELRPKAGSLGLGTVRIVPESRAGKTEYSVQVGTFASRQAANAARGRLGEQAVVVSGQ